MKIVVNRCFGGFGLSDKAIKRYAELSEIPLKEEPSKWSLRTNIYYRTDKQDKDGNDKHFYPAWDAERNDPLLIQTVEELGFEAGGPHSQLEVVEIPDGIDWEISEYDGNEHIAEKHRTW